MDAGNGGGTAARVRGGLTPPLLVGAATTVTFARTQISTAAYTYPVVAADFNSDGKPDLAFASACGTCTSGGAFLNTMAAGATTATYGVQTPFTVSGSTSSIAAADFNGDGKPDLVTGNNSTSNVSVLLNTAMAGATAPSFAARLTLATNGNPYSVTVGDVNGDGKPDIVAGNYGSGSVSVLLNTTAANATTPTFATKVDFSVRVPSGIVIADLNGDGMLDIAVATALMANKLSVLANTATGGATTPSFAAVVEYEASNNPVGIVATDVNGDGRLDIITGQALDSGGVDVFLNTSGYTLAPSSGNNGSAAVGTAFAPLAVHVTDSAGAAVSGVQVTFTAPTSGARGTFAGGATTTTATTTSGGNATAPTFTAGTTVGTFAVSVAVSGAFGSTTQFNLTVTPGPATTVTTTSGTPQNLTVGSAASTALKATVTDANGNPRSGDTVTFTVNAVSGAGATFPGGMSTATATTDTNGVATTPALTANTTPGGYTVTASTGSATSATFSLTNVPGSAASLALTGLATATAGTAQMVTVTAKDAYGNTATGYTGPVMFTSSDPQATLPTGSVNVTNGTGIFSVTLKTVGMQAVTVTGSGSVTGSSMVSVTAAAAATVMTFGGNMQSAAINSQFATTLQAKAMDAFGNAVSGVTVTFTAPGSGASARFPGNATSATAITNGMGIATAPILSTTGTTGTYTVTASVSGVGMSASFALTNGTVTVPPMPRATATAIAPSPAAAAAPRTAGTPAAAAPLPLPMRR